MTFVKRYINLLTSLLIAIDALYLFATLWHPGAWSIYFRRVSAPEFRFDVYIAAKNKNI